MKLPIWIQKALRVVEVNRLPALLNQNMSRMQAVGNEITLYPADSGERYISKGFNLNDAVSSIVTRNAPKFAQIRLYHAKIKRTERKTREEYDQITKGAITDKVIKEARKMQKAMTESREVDSPISRLLNRPNREQTQAEWLEEGYALRELLGEFNIWMPKREGSKTPTEMLIIPKPHLQLIGDGRDPWNIVAYQFLLMGQTYRWEKDEVLMWKYNNPSMLDMTLEKFRGRAPLTPFMIALQGMNEADFAMAAANKNRGAYGFAYREDLTATPSAEQASFMRKQFDDILYNSEMWGKIGLLGGKWGYHNIGLSTEAQKILEQYGVGFKRLCRIFNTPHGIFDEENDTYENQKQYGRKWIYDKIAPAMYQFRDLLSDRLLREFSLDRESNIIDCDIMSLQELTQDMKEQVLALKDAQWLTPNEKRDAMGYEMMEDANMDKIYIPSGYSSLEQLNSDMGESLDNELNLLADGG